MGGVGPPAETSSHLTAPSSGELGANSIPGSWLAPTGSEFPGLGRQIDESMAVAIDGEIAG